MNHLFRAGQFRSKPPTAAMIRAYEAAKAAEKLAYKQGRAKQEMTGNPARLQSLIDARDKSDYERALAMGLKPYCPSRLFADAHQRGLAGFRFDGSKPKRKPSKVDKARNQNG